MKVMLMKRMLEIREKKVRGKKREKERERMKDFYRKIKGGKSDEDEK